MNARGLNFPSSSCMRTPPTAVPEASVTTVYAFSGFGYSNIGASQRAFFNFRNAPCSVGPHCHATSFSITLSNDVQSRRTCRRIAGNSWRSRGTTGLPSHSLVLPIPELLSTSLLLASSLLVSPIVQEIPPMKSGFHTLMPSQTDDAFSAL